MFIVAFRRVGSALLPTYASVWTDKCSNRTSILGNSIPTLFHDKFIGITKWQIFLFLKNLSEAWHYLVYAWNESVQKTTKNSAGSSDHRFRPNTAEKTAACLSLTCNRPLFSEEILEFMVTHWLSHYIMPSRETKIDVRIRSEKLWTKSTWKARATRVRKLWMIEKPPLKNKGTAYYIL